MKLFHITTWSKDKQEKLIPKIPDCTLPGEDVTTNRISMAPTIKDCIRGIGKTFNEKSLIRVYTINIDVNDVNLVDWITLYENEKVDDAPITHEYWYKKEIIPIDYSEYEIRKLVYKPYMVIKASKKDKVIKVIENNGLNISEDLRKKTAIEILDYFRENIKLQDIKKELVYRVVNTDSNSPEIYKKLFKEEPPRYEYVQDYTDEDYMFNCELKKL